MSLYTECVSHTDQFTPLRVAARDEALGVDVSEHGEEGYTDGEGAVLVLETTR